MALNRFGSRALRGSAALAAFSVLSCFQSSTAPDKDWKCVLETGTAPDFATSVGCREDFATLSSAPLDASIPGALSLKTVIDRADGDALYFQNSKKFKIHWEFATANLSGNGKPPVPSLFQFNQTEYYSPDRRFLLGAVTFYEGPGVFAYEISPYDNAAADLIAKAYHKIAATSYFGRELVFHPTSKNVEEEAKKLPPSVKVMTTEELYRGITYQPLNYAVSMGRLIFTTAKRLETEYVSFRDIVVLDAVPNDISVVSGIITQEFQTPLSHINVLSQNRGTPNMGLKGALVNAELRALQNKWVRFEVAPSAWSVTEVTQAEADAWWEANRPPALGIPNLDTTVKDLTNAEDILDVKGLGLAAALKKAVPAFGGKAGHFGAFAHMDTSKVKTNKAFAVPVYHYWRFMQQNGFHDTLSRLLADGRFRADPAERDRRLKALRQAMEAAPVDTAFEAALLDKLKREYPSSRIRFRSSTNAEDLEGFTGAGLYLSKTGGQEDPADPIMRAVRQVWASVWNFRAFEERSYHGIDHGAVGMALLVHRAHPEEEANGVAITANPFDRAGLEPGFYVNVQLGGEEVVSPTPGITTDQFLYHFDMPGQPMVYLAHSSLVPSGTNVLTAAQAYALGTALEEIHGFFQPVYGKVPGQWYAMDTEFKLDQTEGDPSGKPIIILKQARPYPGWGR